MGKYYLGLVEGGSLGGGGGGDFGSQTAKDKREERHKMRWTRGTQIEGIGGGREAADLSR